MHRAIARRGCIVTAWNRLLSRGGAGQNALGRVAIFPGTLCTLGVAVAAGDASAAGRPQATPSPVFTGESTLTQGLAWQRARAGKWSGSLVLHPADYRALQVEAPKVPPAERRDAVRWQLKDLVDFAVDKASVDTLNIPGPIPGASSDRMVAIIAPSERIAGWMAQYREQRCALDSIDIPEMAMRNLAALAAGDAAVAFMHIGLSVTRITVVWQRELCSFRHIELSAHQLADANDSDREALIDRLALNIQRTTDAFARQFHGADLGQLLLSSVACADEVRTRLAEMTGMNVQPFDLTEHLQWPAEQAMWDLAQDYDYTIAAGAALRPPGL